jgi:hypothetical protein
MGRAECTVCGNWLLVQYRPGRIGQCRVHAAFLASDRHCSHCLARVLHRCRGRGTQGRSPDFRALHSGNYSQEDLCVWCSDLLELSGEDRRSLPVIARKQSSRRSCADTIIVCQALGSLQQRRAAPRSNAGSAAPKTSSQREEPRTKASRFDTLLTSADQDALATSQSHFCILTRTMATSVLIAFTPR